MGYRNVLERLSTTPGPGSYTIANNAISQTKSFTFGSRPEQKVRSDTPAPNQYEAEKCNFTRQPSFTFGGRRKDGKSSSTPGKQNPVLANDFQLKLNQTLFILNSARIVFTRKMYIRSSASLFIWGKTQFGKTEPKPW